jgi:hypothetical protein
VTLAALSTGAQATEDFCAVVLKTPDGFLALREGPGAQFRVKARLRQGDVLFADTRTCVIDHPDICDETRKWTYVNYVPRLDGRLNEAKQFTQGSVADSPKSSCAQATSRRS